MNIRWLWGNYIDPDWKLSRPQVRQAHRLVRQKYMPAWKLLGVTFVMLLAAFVLIKTVHMPLAIWLADMGFLYAWMSSMALLAGGIIVSAAWLYRFLYARPMRRAMRDLGHNLCVNCGYLLDGLDEQTRQCPECGSPRPDHV